VIKTFFCPGRGRVSVVSSIVTGIFARRAGFLMEGQPLFSSRESAPVRLLVASDNSW